MACLWCLDYKTDPAPRFATYSYTLLLNVPIKGLLHRTQNQHKKRSEPACVSSSPADHNRRARLLVVEAEIGSAALSLLYSISRASVGSIRAYSRLDNAAAFDGSPCDSGSSSDH